MCAPNGRVHADHPSSPLDPLRVFLTQIVHCTAPALPCLRMHAIDRSPVWRVLEPAGACSAQHVTGGMLQLLALILQRLRQLVKLRS